mmetsp:Transcript_79034/g.189854  ORF Transcript_79034/g.189854 Transcript_79034/m.189854 type:complete len:200 (-) Transcript_79034:1390-1989(-)
MAPKVPEGHGTGSPGPGERLHGELQLYRALVGRVHPARGDWHRVVQSELWFDLPGDGELLLQPRRSHLPAYPRAIGMVAVAAWELLGTVCNGNGGCGLALSAALSFPQRGSRACRRGALSQAGHLRGNLPRLPELLECCGLGIHHLCLCGDRHLRASYHGDRGHHRDDGCLHGAGCEPHLGGLALSSVRVGGECGAGGS